MHLITSRLLLPVDGTTLVSTPSSKDPKSHLLVLFKKKRKEATNFLLERL